MNGYFTTDDMANIYFEDYGGLNKNTILLVHGFQCSTRFFEGNIEALSKENRLVLVDLRGHGKSDKNCSDFSLARMGKDIKQLIDFLRLDNVKLLGWSMGGNVVMEYFKQFGTSKLSSIGLIDSRLYPYSSEAWNTHSCRDFNKAAANIRKEKMLSNYQEYCKSLPKRYFVNDPNEDVVEMILEEMAETDKNTMWDIYNDFLEEDCYSELKSVNLPVLIIATRHIGDDTGKHYLSVVRDGEYHWFDEGHCMMVENPEKFQQIINDFVNK